MMRTRAHRSLFGPTDHVQVQKDLKEELKKISQEGKRKWNFDFDSDSPLQGRFEWYPVSPQDEEIPSFYTRTRSFKRRRSDTTEKSPVTPNDRLDSIIRSQNDLLELDCTHNLPGDKIDTVDLSTTDCAAEEHGRNDVKKGALSVHMPCSSPLRELDLCHTPKRPCIAKNRVRVFSFSDDESSQTYSFSPVDRPKYNGHICTENDKRQSEHNGIISAGER